VLQLLKLPDGTVKVLVEGLSAPVIEAIQTVKSIHEADRPMALPEPMKKSGRGRSPARSVRSEFESYVKLNKKISAEVVGCSSARSRDHSKLADTVASAPVIKIAESRKMLETTISVKPRA
jgi:ATP-dependent Lon protease